MLTKIAKVKWSVKKWSLTLYNLIECLTIEIETEKLKKYIN